MTVPVREDMLENALKCVVGISSADGSKGTAGKNEWYMGSGVLATDDGYIITNHHVIGARPERIVVTLHNGDTIEGKTVWSDSALDLAVVKIDGMVFLFKAWRRENSPCRGKRYRYRQPPQYAVPTHGYGRDCQCAGQKHQH